MDVTWETVKLLRMIVTHGAPCKMLDSNPDKSFTWEEMAEAARSGMEMEFLMRLFEIVRTKNAAIPSSDNIDLTTIRFEDSFVALVGCRIFWQKLLHFAAKGSVCLTHNIMIGDLFNLCQSKYSGLVRKNEHSHQFGKRWSITKKSNNQTGIERDRNDLDRISCLVFRDATENATELSVARSIVEHCRASRLESVDGQNDPGKRLSRYVEHARGLYRPETNILELAQQEYRAQRPNAGNSDNHNATFYADMPTVERLIQEAVDTGNVITIQAEGSCG